MGKYDNGEPVEVPENEDEKALAISEWSEGDEHLKDAISSCLDNGIQTFASCKGHKISDYPYLSMVITPKNIDKITNIINNISNKKGVEITLSFDEENKGSILTITSNMLNKNGIFDLITKSANDSLEFENANNITKEMIRLHETLRIHGNKDQRMKSYILLHNGIINKSINIKHSDGFYDFWLDKNLEKSGFKKKKNIFGKYYYCQSTTKSAKKLKNFNDNLIEYFTYAEMVEDDEFFDKITHEQDRRYIKAITIGKNADEILENIFDDKELASNIIKRIDKLKLSGLDFDKIKEEYGTRANLETKLNKQQSLEIVDNFFKDFGIDVSTLLQKGQMKNENNQIIKLNMNPKIKRNETSNPIYNSDDIYVNIVETGTLSDAYSLVHEISHTLNTDFNESKIILGEVVPQCMERMFDDYLKDLSDEQKEMYGFDKNILNGDIIKRNISTTLDRFNVCKNIIKYNGPKKSEYSRYMFAEIYSNKLSSFNKKERKERINEFISALKNNRFEEASHAFDINISKENADYRNIYIRDCISHFQELLTSNYNNSDYKGKDDKFIEKGDKTTNPIDRN